MNWYAFTPALCKTNHAHGESSVICKVHGPLCGPCAFDCLTNQCPGICEHLPADSKASRIASLVLDGMNFEDALQAVTGEGIA